MQTTAHILRYVFAGILVVILGGFAGWYVFVHRQIAATEATDIARGLGNAPSFSGNGNTFSGTDGGTGVSGAALQGGSTILTGSTGSVAPRLWQVTRSPVAGLGFAASSTGLYFVERSNGNILSADPSLTKVVRITNTLFPRIYEAVFSGDGSVVLRSLSDAGTITSYAAKIATTTKDAGAPSALAGVYLPPDIGSLTARPASRQLFWLLPEGKSGVAGVTSDSKGGSQKRIFASALRGWRAQWLGDGKIYLLQKPADDIPGYAFRLNTNGTLEPVLSGIPGLTVLPKAGSSALLYGSSQGGALSLYAQTSAAATPVRVPLRTLAEKCVWAPGKDLIAYCAVPQSLSGGAYLRNWYEGALHTADAWWKVDASAGTAVLLYRPDPAVTLDVENPSVDASGAYIGFMNALDKSLWMLKINP